MDVVKYLINKGIDTKYRDSHKRDGFFYLNHKNKILLKDIIF